mgnify:FL=1
MRQYKAKVAATMKSNIRSVAIDRAARDGDQLDLEGIEEENLELEQLLKLNQPPPKEYESAMVSTDPIIQADAETQIRPKQVERCEQETMTD